MQAAESGHLLGVVYVPVSLLHLIMYTSNVFTKHARVHVMLSSLDTAFAQGKACITCRAMSECCPSVLQGALDGWHEANHSAADQLWLKFEEQQV